MNFKPEKEYSHENVDALTYAEMAKKEKDAPTALLLKRLAAVEIAHAAFWKKIAEKRGRNIKEPGLIEKTKAKTYVLFRKFFGLSLSIKLLELHEVSAIKEYTELWNTPGLLDEDEKALLEKVIDDEKEHELALINEELRVNPDRVRDVIYGISDALVEVLAAVSGFAGVLAKPLIVAVAGLIVGASGTLSMGAGAYVSTKSEEEAKESNALTDSKAEKSHQSALLSAATTSASYLIGVFPPVLPYAVGLGGTVALLSSYLASAASLFVVGFLVGIVSGVTPSHKGGEMAAIGMGAALATHALGLAASAYLHVSVRR